MKIGIIGAGNVGGAIATKLSAAGHSVKLAGSGGPETISEAAAAAGATAVAAPNAVTDVDVIVLSIPFAAVPDVAVLFANVPADVIVIDTTNYYPFRDGNIAEVDAGKPESVWVGEQIGRPVVKSFNALLSVTLSDMAKPAGTPGRIAVPVAGDDAQAKAIAIKLVEEAGFDAVDAGDLANSWRQHPGTPGYCTELTAPELRDALAAADSKLAPGTRNAVITSFMAGTSLPTREQMVAASRDATAAR